MATEGETITYTMLVTNTGTAAIAGVTVDDPFLDDEAPVLSGGFNVGDADQDNLLDVTETWEFSGTHVVTQDELDSGADIDNTATASGTDAKSDSDDATVAVDQDKSLHIEKDADKATVATEGETITYTMLVTNTGNAAIAGVTVDDPFLDDEAPVLSGGFNVGDADQDNLLDVTETWEFSGTHVVTQDDLDSGADIDNTATASGTDAESDSDDATVAIDQDKSLHIEKDADKATVATEGETITYTMLVTNTGNAAIAGVTVDDPFLDDEAPVLSGGFNVGDADQDNLLDVTETWEFSGTHVVTQDELDSGADIDNTATASGTDAESDSDDATVAIDQDKSLHIEKDADKATVATEGETITYTMVVTNTGNAAIAGVTVDDPFLDDEAPVLSGGFNVGDADQDNLLDVTETWEFSGTHVVTQDDLDSGADIDNTATASGTDAELDSDDATVAIDQDKSLHIEKDADKATVATEGETITYTMLVTNTGNAAIAGVTVDDPFLDDEAPVLSGGFNVGDADQDNLLDVTETWEFSGTHVVTQDELDSGADIDNTATASGTDAESDSDDATVAIEQDKSLHIEKDADKATVATEGETITYTMVVTNTGNAAIAGVTVDDPFLDDEAPVLSGGFNVGDADQDNLLDVTETWEFSGTHVVTQDDLDAGADIDNTATASGTDAESDSDDATVAD